MPKHHYQFVEKYQGLVGFGLDRPTDENALTFYLQKFADDEHMALMRQRLTDQELTELFELLTRLLRKHLSDTEYHHCFLKDEEE